MKPGSLLNPADLDRLLGPCNISSPHFQLRYSYGHGDGNNDKGAWEGTHLIEFVPDDGRVLWRYIKGFPPGGFHLGRAAFYKLERLYPCHFLAKEYPQSID